MVALNITPNWHSAGNHHKLLDIYRRNYFSSKKSSINIGPLNFKVEKGDKGEEKTDCRKGIYGGVEILNCVVTVFLKVTVDTPAYLNI